ncbi:MAG: helix-turn-helix transcriptional regulator [bacterium]|nr:helix-turn-helix transcriptional regulator [bacterium]
MNERLKSLRKLHRLSQNDVAYRLGISQQSYSRFETGTSDIPASFIVILCDLYQVSADYILCIGSLRPKAFVTPD